MVCIVLYAQLLMLLRNPNYKIEIVVTTVV